MLYQTIQKIPKDVSLWFFACQCVLWFRETAFRWFIGENQHNRETLFSQNKPNFNSAPGDLSSFSLRTNNDGQQTAEGPNKPNSNPNKANSKPKLSSRPPSRDKSNVHVSNPRASGLNPDGNKTKRTQFSGLWGFFKLFKNKN